MGCSIESFFVAFFTKPLGVFDEARA